jgi:outer membrane receptor protein involved in Fe transport
MNQQIKERNSHSIWVIAWTVTGLLVTPLAFSQEEENELIELSPFEVSSSDQDVGYYASSTLAGTRMNSNLVDIPGSISIITKAQLEDTGSVDINDVFQFESNTEGIATYTEFTLDRYGSANDRVLSAPQTANRIRGIGAADIARNYFVGLSSIPFDSYNVDRLDLNRGPNSVLYGLGSPSGLVNASPSKAVLGSNTNQVRYRFGKWGAQRASVNLNRTIIEDKLAIRVAALTSDKGIRQQPAYDESTRYYGAITYRPTENTHVRASMEHYENERQAAGAVTQADLISPWMDAGMPMWNPSELTLTLGDGSLRELPGGIAFEQNGLRRDEHRTRPLWISDQGVSTGTRIQRAIGNTGNANVLNPSTGEVSSVSGYYTGLSRANQPETLSFSDGPFERKATAPGFITPGIQDISIYDYRFINISSANFYSTDAEIYDLSVEHQFTDNLFVELAYHREDATTVSENGINANQAKVYIDTDSHYLDGSVNPYAGMPFIETRQEVDAQVRPERQDVMRATAAYKLDFTESDGPISWLGHHNIMGLGQSSQSDARFKRFRPGSTTFDSSYGRRRNGDGTFRETLGANNPEKASNRRYYLNDSGPTIAYGPGSSPTAPFIPAFNDVRGVDWPSEDLYHFAYTGRDGDPDYPHAGGRPTGNWITEPQNFAFLDRGGDHTRDRIDSYSAAVQSYFWKDRIITTLGYRKDKRFNWDDRNEDASGNPVPTVHDEGNGYAVGDPLFGARSWDRYDLFPDEPLENSGSTTSKGFVINPLRENTDLPVWLQEFRFHFNQSDSYEPSSINRNLYGGILENPTGTSEDWGISFPMLDNTLHAKLNFYDATAYNSRAGGDTGTVVGRARRVETDSFGYTSFIEWNLELRDGLELGSLNFMDEDDALTNTYVDEIYELTGIQPGTLRGTAGQGLNDVRNISSKGMEFELSYNPQPNFNIKFNLSRQQTIEEGGAPFTSAWVAERLPIWTQAGSSNANFPDNPQVNWWTGNVAGSDGVAAREDPNWAPAEGEEDYRWRRRPGEASSWVLGNLLSPMALLTELNGLPRPQVREWRSRTIATYRFTEGKMKGLMVGGSMRWEDESALGFKGTIDENGVLIRHIDQPVLGAANDYYDFWTSYSGKLNDGKLSYRVQLNVSNLFEDGRLQPLRVNPDGNTSTFRIVEPRQVYITTTLDF